MLLDRLVSADQQGLLALLVMPRILVQQVPLVQQAQRVPMAPLQIRVLPVKQVKQVQRGRKESLDRPLERAQLDNEAQQGLRVALVRLVVRVLLGVKESPVLLG